MSYNKTNYYKRIIEIQNKVIDLKIKDDCITYKEIFWQYIHPQYFICYKTFHTYLGVNAKRELTKITNN